MKRADTPTNLSDQHEDVPVIKSLKNLVTACSNKLKKFLFEERRLLKRKRVGNEIIPPAPFYDELHFADYE